VDVGMAVTRILGDLEIDQCLGLRCFGQSDVRFWHLADIALCVAHVCF
jgi:hypothetical protein